MKNEAVLKAVLEHICENAVKKNIQIVAINGVADHIHLLLRLKSIETLAKTMMLIKGEASWWIKRNLPDLESFEWQSGYHTRPVPEEQVAIVTDYINKQQDRNNKAF